MPHAPLCVQSGEQLSVDLSLQVPRALHLGREQDASAEQVGSGSDQTGQHEEGGGPMEGGPDAQKGKVDARDLPPCYKVEGGRGGIEVSGVWVAFASRVNVGCWVGGGSGGRGGGSLGCQIGVLTHNDDDSWWSWLEACFSERVAFYKYFYYSHEWWRGQ